MLDKFFIEENEEIEPSHFLEQLWEEKKSLGKIAFKYLEESADSSNIFHISHNLNTFPAGEVLSADYLIEEFEPRVIYDYIIDMLDPGNLMILVGNDEYIFNGVEQIPK